MTTKKGSDDDDILTASNAGDKIYGLAGNDTITGGKGNDVLDGGVGNDNILGGGGNDKITCGDDGAQQEDGGNTIDEADGGAGKDILHGLDGTQWLHGGNGIDMLFGGNDNDFLFGDNGSDTLDGEDGNDYLNGGTGKNTLLGGDGDDTLESRIGNDTMDGGKGNDLYEIGSKDGFKQHLRVNISDTNGSETYQIFNADTQVLISDRSGTDKLDFNSLAGTTKDTLVFTHTNNDLVIEAHGYQGETTIVNFFLSKAYRPEYLLAHDPDTDLPHSFDLSELKHLDQGKSEDGSHFWL